MTWQRSHYDYKHADSFKIICIEQVHPNFADWSLKIKGCSEKLWQTVVLDLTEEQIEKLHFELGVALMEKSMEKDKANE